MTCLARVVHLVDRYGDAIEADLHIRAGLDLLDFFRGKFSWRKLLVVVDHLPSGSAFWAARAADDELAEEIAKQDQQRKKAGITEEPSAPALTEMSFTNQLLMSLVDLQSLAVDRLERSMGSRPALPKPLPRPKTAIEKAKELREAAAIQDLIAEVATAQLRN